MILKLTVIFASLAFTACSTPTKYDQLPEVEREQLHTSNAEINRLAECRDSAEGNEVMFNAKCSKLLAGKKLYAKFREADTQGDTYTVKADVSETVNIVCQVPPSPATTAALAKLRPMDGIYIVGDLKRFTTTEKNSPFRKRALHEVDMSTCDVKTNPSTNL